MGKGKKAATKAEKARMAAMVEAGCAACRSDTGHEWLRPVEVHHLKGEGMGAARLGHAATVALCSWHHRGTPPAGFNVSTATERFGPSLYHDGRAFKARYGDDKALLAFAEYLLTLG